MRLQVMHLPAPAEEFPFALVIDQCEHAFSELLLKRTADEIGARTILVFEEEVEVA